MSDTTHSKLFDYLMKRVSPTTISSTYYYEEEYPMLPSHGTIWDLNRNNKTTRGTSYSSHSNMYRVGFNMGGVRDTAF